MSEDSHKTLTRFARIGFAAKAVVYITMGCLAADAGLRAGGGTPSQQSIMSELASIGGGILLWIIAAGLGLYATWRFVRATTAHEEETHTRVGYAGSGVANGSLAIMFGAFAAGAGSGGGNRWLDRFMADPIGKWLVVGLGIAFLIAGIAQIGIGIRGRFMERLQLPDQRMETGVRTFGTIGFIARGVVFGLIGGGLVAAALRIGGESGEQQGLSQAFRTLQEQPYGPWLLVLVASGLIAYGALAGLMSCYRVIRT